MDVVCGIIQKENRYLIAKRGKGVDEGIWEFPGGKVESEETKQEAVMRELKEELSIDVQILSYVTTIVDQHATETIYVSAYLCEIIKGCLTLHVHDEYRWVTAKELYAYKFQNADIPILDELQENVT